VGTNFSQARTHTYIHSTPVLKGMEGAERKNLTKNLEKSRSTPVIGRHIGKPRRLPGLRLISTIHASVGEELGFS
jgi:hypothetical protein